MAHPGDAIKLVTTDSKSELTAETNDLIVLYSVGDHPNWMLWPLFSEELVPVAAPEHLSRSGCNAADADLPATEIAKLTLFDYDRINANWKTLRDWFHWRGVDLQTVAPRVVFPNFPMAVDAALSGQGVILGSRALVREFLDDGRLVQLSQQVLVTGYGYYVGLPKDRPAGPEALRLQQWLRAHATAAAPTSLGRRPP